MENSNHGGARSGSGRKKVEGLKQRPIYLTDEQLVYLKTKYKSLPRAVKSLFPAGWDIKKK